MLVDEEPQISPTLAIFFEGCNLGCRFCMAYEHTRSADGLSRGPQTADRDLCRDLCDVFTQAGQMQVRTVSLLGGEPSLYLDEARAAWMTTRRNGAVVPPVVLNSNMLLDPDDIRRRCDFVSFYVADLKFGNDACAQALTSRPARLGKYRKGQRERGYFETVTSAIQTAASQPASQVIIRHLPVPGHVQCCTIPALEWVERSMPDTEVHLMMDYYPNGRSGMPDVERTLTRGETTAVLDAAGRLRVRQIPPSRPRAQTREGADMPTLSPSSVIIREDGRVLIPDLPRELGFLVEELCPETAGISPSPGRARPNRGSVAGDLRPGFRQGPFIDGVYWRH